MSPAKFYNNILNTGIVVDTITGMLQANGSTFSKLPLDLLELAKRLDGGMSDARVGSFETLVRIRDSSSDDSQVPPAQDVWVETGRDIAIRGAKQVHRYRCSYAAPCNTNDRDFALVTSSMITDQWLCQGFNTTVLFGGGEGKTYNFVGSKYSILDKVLNDIFASIPNATVGISCWAISSEDIEVDLLGLNNGTEFEGFVTVACTSVLDAFELIRKVYDSLPDHVFVRVIIANSDANRVSTAHFVDLKGSPSAFSTRKQKLLRSQHLGFEKIVAELSRLELSNTSSSSFLNGTRDSALSRHLTKLIGQNNKCFFVQSLGNKVNLDLKSTLKFLTRISLINTACVRIMNRDQVTGRFITLNRYMDCINRPTFLNQNSQNKPDVSISKVPVAVLNHDLEDTLESISSDSMEATSDLHLGKKSPSANIEASSNLYLGKKAPSISAKLEDVFSKKTSRAERIELNLNSLSALEAQSISSEDLSQANRVRVLELELSQIRSSFEAKRQGFMKENQELQRWIETQNSSCSEFSLFQKSLEFAKQQHERSEDDCRRITQQCECYRFDHENARFRIKAVKGENILLRNKLKALRKQSQQFLIRGRWLNQLEDNLVSTNQAKENITKQLDESKKSNPDLQYKLSHVQRLRNELTETVDALLVDRRKTSLEVSDIRSYLSKVESEYEKRAIISKLNSRLPSHFNGVDASAHLLLSRLESIVQKTNPSLFQHTITIRNHLETLGDKRLRLEHREYQATDAIKSLCATDLQKNFTIF